MDSRKLDLNLLVVMDTMLEERGVNATARRLGMSQPNVSFALSKLRAFFGDDLFVRQGNRMQPTPTSERLREPIRRALAIVESEVLRTSSFDALSTERRFSISTSDIGELVFLPRLMKALGERAPHATMRVHLLRPTELMRAMADGLVDLALGYFPDLDESAFVQQKVFDHPFVCLVRRNHPSVGDSLDLDEFLSLGHIVVSHEGRSQEVFERRMSELGLSRRIVLQSPNFMSVPFLVAGSDLVATVPKAVGMAFRDLVPLKLIEPPLELPSIVLRQLWHRRVHHDPAVKWLRALVAELFLRDDPSMPPEADENTSFWGFLD